MRHALYVLVAAVAAVLIAAYLHPAPSAAEPREEVSVAAPTSAAGYTALWDTLDPEIWGAADVSLSVPMDDGRTVWLYGDTFSTSYGLVHSTAITQDGGTLHVSNRGLQLLPDAANGDAYWIEGAHRVGGTQIAVTAQRVRIGTANGLDFHRVGTLNRTALLEIDPAGDVTFQRWTGTATPPALDTHFLTPAEGAPYQREGHLFYGKRSHPQAALESGQTLVTISQNRVEPALLADGSVDFSQYRPIFSEE